MCFPLHRGEAAGEHRQPASDWGPCAFQGYLPPLTVLLMQSKCCWVRECSRWRASLQAVNKLPKSHKNWPLPASFSRHVCPAGSREPHVSRLPIMIHIPSLSLVGASSQHTAFIAPKNLGSESQWFWLGEGLGIFMKEQTPCICALTGQRSQLSPSHQG